MIISFKHSYIFIRPKKVAGSTIEEVLLSSLGDGDILVKRDREPLAKRLNGCARPNATEIEIEVHQHMTAPEIYALVTDDYWNRTFKFTATRHPYERLVSHVYYRLAKEQDIAQRGRQAPTDFNDCVRRLLNRGVAAEGPKYFLLEDGKTLAVDAIIRQERLHEDLKRVGGHLGIPIPDELPRRKGSVRADRRPAHELLNQEQKDEVYRQARIEFELLGYER